MKSVSPHSEVLAVVPTADSTAMLGAGEQADDAWFEHLTGVRSGKPSFYAAWRRSEADLERSMTALREISTALCSTSGGAHELSRAVALAASHHFDADCFAIIPDGGRSRRVSFETVALVGGVEEAADFTTLPVVVKRLASTAAELGCPVLLIEDSDCRITTIEAAEVGASCNGLAVPLVADDRRGGGLVILPHRPSIIDRADVAIAQTLAQQLVVALHNAAYHQESEDLRREVARERRDANTKSRELETQNRRLEETRIELSRERQQRLIAAERARIATELHDSVVQHLISIGMNLEWCRRSTESGTALSARLASTHELSKTALGRVRTTIFELSCMAGEDQDLVSALGGLARMLGSQVRVMVCHNGDLSSLSPAEEHSAFHFVQEAIFNAMRHGNAKNIWVDLQGSRQAFRITVDDDSSSDYRELSLLLRQGCQTSSGIDGMRARASELGGVVEVQPRPDGGIRLILAVEYSVHQSE